VKASLGSATSGKEKLQAGERDAILLAESIAADMVLLDENAARRVAADRGLRIAGTLGVLGEAAARGLVDLAAAMDRLTGTSFRYSPALLKATLDRFGKRGQTTKGDRLSHCAAGAKALIVGELLRHG
jgi:predicted nucleic acid-binding protein